ncbi:hypothetical protein V6N11_013832 [Hibiscus sabdariffa]|uniref:Uncharacterized protein n=2 Tax=Hibiscus sabdariffa TaxID=183260 RepID=A0ABR2ED72_9ROSI
MSIISDRTSLAIHNATHSLTNQKEWNGLPSKLILAIVDGDFNPPFQDHETTPLLSRGAFGWGLDLTTEVRFQGGSFFDLGHYESLDQL